MYNCTWQYGFNMSTTILSLLTVWKMGTCWRECHIWSILWFKFTHVVRAVWRSIPRESGVKFIIGRKVKRDSMKFGQSEKAVGTNKQLSIWVNSRGHSISPQLSKKTFKNHIRLISIIHLFWQYRLKASYFFVRVSIPF